MWMLLPLLLLPLVVMLGFWATNRDTFTWKEFLALEAGMVPILIAGFLFARWGATADTEIWSGRITAKPHGSQKCCHCTTVCDTCYREVCTGSGKSRSCRQEPYDCRCREVCDHFQDYWWAVDVSTGDRITIRNCESSKWDVPAAWTNARIGEPAAVEHRYTNYLLADPDSVLRQSAEVSGKAPAYPRVYSFYRVDRALNLGTAMPVGEWNRALMEANADLGHKKQVNLVVIATANPNPSYAQVVERDWLYGKKNDLVFVFGAPNGDDIEWARIVTISNVEMLKIKVRDGFVGKTLSDVEDTMGSIRMLVEHEFERTPMAEFEYLGTAAKPGTLATIILYLLALGISVGGSLFMVHNDVFGDERRSRRRW